MMELGMGECPQGHRGKLEMWKMRDLSDGGGGGVVPLLGMSPITGFGIRNSGFFLGNSAILGTLDCG